MYIPSAEILPYSYYHNFVASSKSVSCSYGSGYITCSNINTFVKSTTYFISFRAYYAAAPITTITNFGEIQIKAVLTDSFGVSTTSS